MFIRVFREHLATCQQPGIVSQPQPVRGSKQLRMARIVVIGSVAVDEVVKLHDPLIEGTHLAGHWNGPRLGGGASCTAVPLALAGHDVMIVGSIGQDERGDDLLAELTELGIDTRHIARLDQPTTRSLILVNGCGERTIINVVRTHEEEPPRRLLEIAADCIYVRSRRGDLSELLEAKVADSLVIAHVPPWENQARPAHILVASASDVGAELLYDPFKAGQRIAGQHLQWVIVTHGASGVVAYAEHRTVRAPARRVQPIDTTGAGDTFAAGLVHALMSGASVPESLDTAVAWGGEATLWESSVLPPMAVAALLA